MKHWIIAANLGHDGSMKELMHGFKKGVVSKADLAAALRAHQAAVDAMQSPQRDAAYEYYHQQQKYDYLNTDIKTFRLQHLHLLAFYTWPQEVTHGTNK